MADTENNLQETENQQPENQQALEFMAEEEDESLSKNLTKNSRMGFIKKVFGIVATMLSVTTCFVA